MHKQLWLECIEQEEDAHSLWERFPEQARAELTQQCARLMPQWLVRQVQQAKRMQEVGDEPSQH
jgi:hypothetical protein